MSSRLLPNCTHQPSDTPLKLDPRKAAGRVLQNMQSICFIEVIRGSWGTKVLLIVNSWDCINISISIAYLQKSSNHRCARFLRKQQRILNFLYFSIGNWVFSKRGKYKRRSGREIEIFTFGLVEALNISWLTGGPEEDHGSCPPLADCGDQVACFVRPKFTPAIISNLQWIFSPNLPAHSFSASLWPHGPRRSLCLDGSSLYCHGRPLPTSHTWLESSTTFIYSLDSLEDDNERKSSVQTSGCRMSVAQDNTEVALLQTGGRKLLWVLPTYCQLFSIVVHF